MSAEPPLPSAAPSTTANSNVITAADVWRSRNAHAISPPLQQHPSAQQGLGASEASPQLGSTILPSDSASAAIHNHHSNSPQRPSHTVTACIGSDGHAAAQATSPAAVVAETIAAQRYRGAMTATAAAPAALPLERPSSRLAGAAPLILRPTTALQASSVTAVRTPAHAEVSPRRVAADFVMAPLPTAAARCIEWAKRTPAGSAAAMAAREAAAAGMDGGSGTMGGGPDPMDPSPYVAVLEGLLPPNTLSSFLDPAAAITDALPHPTQSPGAEPDQTTSGIVPVHVECSTRSAVRCPAAEASIRAMQVRGYPPPHSLGRRHCRGGLHTDVAAHQVPVADGTRAERAEQFLLRVGVEAHAASVAAQLSHSHAPPAARATDLTGNQWVMVDRCLQQGPPSDEGLQGAIAAQHRSHTSPLAAADGSPAGPPTGTHYAEVITIDDRTCDGRHGLHRYHYAPLQRAADERGVGAQAADRARRVTGGPNNTGASYVVRNDIERNRLLNMQSRVLAPQNEAELRPPEAVTRMRCKNAATREAAAAEALTERSSQVYGLGCKPPAQAAAATGHTGTSSLYAADDEAEHYSRSTAAVPEIKLLGRYPLVVPQGGPHAPAAAHASLLQGRANPSPSTPRNTAPWLHPTHPQRPAMPAGLVEAAAVVADAIEVPDLAFKITQTPPPGHREALVKAHSARKIVSQKELRRRIGVPIS